MSVEEVIRQSVGLFNFELGWHGGVLGNFMLTNIPTKFELKYGAQVL